MTHEEYQAAANHWIEKDAASKKMPAAPLWTAIENYIQANNTCALATGSGSFIRCTPIEYAWHDGAFWMFSEGGQKFIGLEENKSVCLAIYDRYDGFGKLKGLQVSGRAEIVEPFSAEYIHAAEWKKIPVDALARIFGGALDEISGLLMGRKSSGLNWTAGDVYPGEMAPIIMKKNTGLQLDEMKWDRRYFYVHRFEWNLVASLLAPGTAEGENTTPLSDYTSLAQRKSTPFSAPLRSLPNRCHWHLFGNLMMFSRSSA